MPVQSVQTAIELCSNCGHTFQTRSLQSPATPSRLREYYAPPGEEKAAAQESLAAAEAEFQRCEAEISRLERLLHGLNAERHRISMIITENKSLLSPIRRLPAELLSTVFEFCLPGFTAPITPLFEALDGPILCTPFRIAAICHFWREVAMSLPSLWATIVLNLDSARDMTANILSAFLDYSGKHDLHLFLKTTGKRSINPVTSLIAANCFRVSHMKLLATSDPFISFPDLLFSQLTTFGFTCNIDEGGDLDSFPWLISASQLRSVVLDNVGRLRQFIDGIRNENITFLATSDRCVSQTFWVLRSFPSVREGHVEADELASDEETGKNCMEFPDMRSLNIRRPGFENDPTTSELDIGPYLTSLTLPLLSTIRLANENDSWPLNWRLSDFASFLSRSGISDKITTFDLRGIVGTSHQQIIETLELMPAITDLVLYDFPPSSGMLASAPLFTRLTVDDNHRPLLPALARLKVRFCTDDATDDTAERLSLLVSLIKSRSPGAVPQTVSSLQHLWFKLISPTGEETITGLVECRLFKLGVRVHAEALTNDERDQWLQSSEGRDWYAVH